MGGTAYRGMLTAFPRRLRLLRPIVVSLVFLLPSVTPLIVRI